MCVRSWENSWPIGALRAGFIGESMKNRQIATYNGHKYVSCCPSFKCYYSLNVGWKWRWTEISHYWWVKTKHKQKSASINMSGWTIVRLAVSTVKYLFSSCIYTYTLFSIYYFALFVFAYNVHTNWLVYRHCMMLAFVAFYIYLHIQLSFQKKFGSCVKWK